MFVVFLDMKIRIEINLFGKVGITNIIKIFFLKELFFNNKKRVRE